LAVPLLLRSLEETSFSTWLRESNSVFAFYFILLFHTFGLAMLVGANAIVDLRILGVAASLPLAPLKRFFSIMWIGFTLTRLPRPKVDFSLFGQTSLLVSTKAWRKS
jgi:hypothetical protein